MFSVHIISNLARLHLPLGDRYQPERYVTRRYKGILHMGPPDSPSFSVILGRVLDLGNQLWIAGMRPIWVQRDGVILFVCFLYLEALSVDVESWPGPLPINRKYRGSYSISRCQAFPNLKTFRDDNISTILDQVR
jgi:hypothetical protein